MDFLKFVSLDDDRVFDSEAKLGSFSKEYKFFSPIERFQQQIESITYQISFLDAKDVERITELCQKTPKIKYLSPYLFIFGWCLYEGYSQKQVFDCARHLSETNQIVLNVPSIIRYFRFIKKIQSGNKFDFAVVPNKVF